MGTNRECRGPEPTILPVPTTAAAESVLLCQPTIRHILSRDQAANRQHLALETTSCWRLCFGPVSSGFWPIKCIQFACKIKSDKKRVTIENASKQQPRPPPSNPGALSTPLVQSARHRHARRHDGVRGWLGWRVGGVGVGAHTHTHSCGALPFLLL